MSRLTHTSAVLIALLPGCASETGDTANVDEVSDGIAGPPTDALRGISGKCLDIAGGSPVNGTKIQLWRCNASAAQQWNLENGVVTAVGGKCLDVTGNSSADGTKIQIWDCFNGSNQVWSYNGGQLVGLAGKCATVAGGSPANGTKVQLSTCNGSDSQRWTYVAGRLIGIGGKCMDVSGGGAAANGNSVQIWDCGDVAQQKFIFKNVRLRANAGGCLDVKDGQTANGTLVQEWACNGNPQQQWTFNGTALTGIGQKCLDISGATTADGTQAQIWDCVSPAVVQQQWYRSDQAFYPVAPLSTIPSTVAGSCKFGGYCARSSSTAAHSGVDYPVPANTTVNVYAICDGDVVIAKSSAVDIWNRFTIIKAKNCGGYSTLYLYYGHVDPKAGIASVKRGDIIATVAEWSGNKHLHFGLRTSYESSNWGYYPTGTSTTSSCGTSTDTNAADNIRGKSLASSGWLDPHSFGFAYNWWSGGVSIATCQ